MHSDNIGTGNIVFVSSRRIELYIGRYIGTVTSKGQFHFLTSSQWRRIAEGMEPKFPGSQSKIL